MGKSYAYELASLQSWELVEGINETIKKNFLKNFKDAGSKLGI